MTPWEVPYDADRVIASLAAELGAARADAHKLKARLDTALRMAAESEEALARALHEAQELRDAPDRQEAG